MGAGVDAAQPPQARRGRRLPSDPLQFKQVGARHPGCMASRRWLSPQSLQPGAAAHAPRSIAPPIDSGNGHPDGPGWDRHGGKPSNAHCNTRTRRARGSAGPPPDETHGPHQSRRFRRSLFRVRWLSPPDPWTGQLHDRPVPWWCARTPRSAVRGVKGNEARVRAKGGEPARKASRSEVGVSGSSALASRAARKLRLHSGAGVHVAVDVAVGQRIH
jgi:hypothetical protein